MNAKHTPGPWDKPESQDRGKSQLVGIGAEEDMSWATVYGKNREANAALIAASPDLLAALEPLAHYAEQLDQYGAITELIKQARAAIAKAKGE